MMESRMEWGRMKWTQDTAYVPGFYWWKRWATDRPTVLQVINQGPFWAALLYPTTVDVKQLAGWWYGPIEEPPTQ